MTLIHLRIKYSRSVKNTIIELDLASINLKLELYLTMKLLTYYTIIAKVSRPKNRKSRVGNRSTHYVPTILTRFSHYH